MECFYHEGLGAIGVCKSCMRGLCRECAIEMPRGLACKGRCEADVDELADLIAHNIKFSRAMRANVGPQRTAMIVAGAFIVLMGGVFTTIGLATQRRVWVLAAIGIPMALYGIFLVVRAYRFQVPR